MSTGSPFEPTFVSPMVQQPKRSSAGSWILGLVLVGLGFLTLGGIVCIAGVWYVTTNIDRWLVGLGREALVAMVEESEIPAEEKADVIVQIDRVVIAYKERQIDQTDLQRVLTELEETPALQVLSLYGLEDAYFDGSDLTNEEVEQGRRTFQRALRGVYEKKFSADDLYAGLPGQVDLDPSDSPATGGQLTLVADAAEKPVTGDDIREWLVKLQVMADNSRIPNEPFQLDIGDEVKKVVDGLLAGKAAP